MKRAAIREFAKWFKRQKGRYEQDLAAHCLASWARRWKTNSPTVFGSRFSFHNIFNTSTKASQEIYYPPEGSKGYQATRASALRMLEHLAETGRVNWDIPKTP